VGLPGVNPGYTHPITTASGNPLGGRMGYGNLSATYPSFNGVTLDFGTQLAGKVVRLRFRFGADQANGAEGWDINDVAVEGITNKPFPMQVPETTACERGAPMDRPPPDELPGCCDAGPIRRGNLALVAGVLALLLRRRRR